jgi:hypothetical protein
LALWLVAAVSGILCVWLLRSGIREVDLSPAPGLADPVGNALGAIYAGVLLAATTLTCGILVGLGRSLPPLRRRALLALAGSLIALVVVVLVLLLMSASRLTYV